MRRLIIDSIRNDPEWIAGSYTKQPKSAQYASIMYNFATNGGNLALYRAAPTREKADALLNARLKAPFPADANDTLYQWDSSRDYNPSAGLEKITAHLLAINSTDDERNPPETNQLQDAVKRVKNGRFIILPIGDSSLGHGTTGQAKNWKQHVADLLLSAPRLAK